MQLKSSLSDISSRPVSAANLIKVDKIYSIDVSQLKATLLSARAAGHTVNDCREEIITVLHLTF